MKAVGIALLLAAAAVPAVGFAAWQTAASGPRQEVLAHVLYWLMPVYLAIAGVTVWRRLRVAGRAWRRPALRAIPGLLLAAVLAAAVLAWVGPRMRVQFDETSLAGTAQGMHRQRAALMTTGAVPYAGEVLPLEQTLDKRPPLFPFLVSVLHDLSGCRLANAFVLNGFLLAVALFGVGAFAGARLGRTAALAAPLLLLAVPLTTVVATSAGFELLAATLWLLVLLAALDFVRAPDAARWNLLLGAGLPFAATRYESLPALVLLVAGAAWAARGRWRLDRGGTVLLAALPALLLPLVLLLLHARDPRFYPEAEGRALLAGEHLAAHVGPFLAATFAPALANPLPGVLASAALLAWAVRCARRAAGVGDGLAGLPVLAATVLALAWFYGDVHEPTALRLFLPFAWWCALSPLLLLPWLGRVGGLVLLLAAAALAGVRTAAVRAGEAFPDLVIARLTDAVDRVLPALAADPATTLWIATPAQHLIVKGHAALCAASFARRAADVAQLRRRGDLRTVFVVETPLDAGMAPQFGDPQEVLRALPSEVVHRGGGDTPLVVHRLLP